LEDTQAEGKKALAAERADREALLKERDEREAWKFDFFARQNDSDSLMSLQAVSSTST
jgi:hypothetical protein